MTQRALVSTLAVFVAGMAVGALAIPPRTVEAQAGTRVFELRTYTAPEGKLSELQARFRNHTMRLFQKHGITNVGYWVPQDAPLSQNTLVYVISHPNREAAKKNWAAFQADPEWQKVAADSQVNGRILSGVVSVFMDATDFSPMK
jgi:hypothetical protein